MKHVAPRLPTPVTPASGSSQARLLDDVVAEDVKRLARFSVVSGGLWAVGLLMDAVIFPRAVGAVPSPSSIVIEVLAVVTAVAIFCFARFSAWAPHVKADAGLWLMLLNAAGVAALETWASNPNPEMVGHLSWIAIVILVSAMVMPSTPRKMLVAALAAASMGPLGVWFAHLRGVPVPSVALTFITYLPNYTCAIAAVLPSMMFQRMGRRLREARELGSYELVDRLGQGGMGEVWRARHRWLARDAAIKLVRPEIMGADSGSQARTLLRRFEREARATAALSSQHSIRLFDFGTTDEGTFYYVMELLDGRDLETLVKEHGPLPAARVLYLLRQVCHSLAEAHARGLIHRDVKPANIFVCRMGLDYDFVKVLDFGLVHFQDPGIAEASTQTLLTSDHVVGTPGYMAPEVILGNSAIDRRADVYALGCVAYFLLTGKRVFQQGTPMQSLIDHVHTLPVPPSQATTLEIPAEVDALVLACLDKDPARRPQGATELMRMIADCKECRTWSSDEAQRWWREHLPELSGPLALEQTAFTDASAGEEIREHLPQSARA